MRSRGPEPLLPLAAGLALVALGGIAVAAGAALEGALALALSAAFLWLTLKALRKR